MRPARVADKHALPLKALYPKMFGQRVLLAGWSKFVAWLKRDLGDEFPF